MRPRAAPRARRRRDARSRCRPRTRPHAARIARSVAPSPTASIAPGQAGGARRRDDRALAALRRQRRRRVVASSSRRRRRTRTSTACTSLVGEAERRARPAGSPRAARRSRARRARPTCAQAGDRLAPRRARARRRTRAPAPPARRASAARAPSRSPYTASSASSPRIARSVSVGDLRGDVGPAPLRRASRFPRRRRAWSRRRGRRRRSGARRAAVGDERAVTSRDVARRRVRRARCPARACPADRARASPRASARSCSGDICSGSHFRLILPIPCSAATVPPMRDAPRAASPRPTSSMRASSRCVVRDEVLVRMPVAGVAVRRDRLRRRASSAIASRRVRAPRASRGYGTAQSVDTLRPPCRAVPRAPRSFMCAGTAWRTRRASRSAASPSYTRTSSVERAVRLREREPLVERRLGVAERLLLHVDERLGASRPAAALAALARDRKRARVEELEAARDARPRSSRAATTKRERVLLGRERDREADDLLGQRQQRELRLDARRRACPRCRRTSRRIVRERVAHGVLLQRGTPQLDDGAVGERHRQRAHVRPRRAVAERARTDGVARDGAADRALLLARGIGREQQALRGAARLRSPTSTPGSTRMVRASASMSSTRSIARSDSTMPAVGDRARPSCSSARPPR